MIIYTNSLRNTKKPPSRWSNQNLIKKQLKKQLKKK